jgi:L-seryl-tRNA(Ser) seleniumtransferase
MSDLRRIPSVDILLQSDQALKLIQEFGRPQTLLAIREILQEKRGNQNLNPLELLPENILNLTHEKLEDWFHSTLIPVINATGVILHTNLGRAPLSKNTEQAIKNIASGYNTLEYDLILGKRGSRTVHAEQLLTRLTGAEAAIIVNNNASAVLLALSALANRKKVVIARSQLIEIGGGFRIPDVMKQSGAKLLEVGTTNRVHARDYENALDQPVGLIMRAHHSNFKIIGFTSEPALAEITQIAHRFDIPVLDDLGSGTFIDTSKYGLSHEPTILESIADGADLVCFSGDKLLGGPQAGILIGKKQLINKLKKHPLARAIRADKLCLAGISETLLHYLRDEAENEIPVWQMISKNIDDLKLVAQSWVDELQTGAVIPSFSTIGGGSLPEETLPTFVFAIKIKNPNGFLKNLRKLNFPIIARVEDDQVILDPRTVLPEQNEFVLSGLRTCLK